jgi:hypothetical protein
MSEIQRWEVDNIISSKTHHKFEKGRYVLYTDHVKLVEAAVLAERERCLVIVENMHGYSINLEGDLHPDPNGYLVRRSRMDTAIRWVKVE